MEPLPVRMKAPADYRHVWRGGVLQVMVTRACDLSCIGCTQGSNLGGKPMVMTPRQFRVACESLRGYTGVVGMFGGNPCVHPQFEDLCSVMADVVPWEQRGLWSNNLNGHGRLCREVFNPEVSNLNVHTKSSAYLEMQRDWPEARPKGGHDSRHSPPFVAIGEVHGLTDEHKWRLIQTCDVNQLWSALIGVFRGELRGWFCELAGAQSMLHEMEPDYPDTGVPVTSGWWERPIASFEHQVRKHCWECGIPLRGLGDLAVTGTLEQVSPIHERVYQLKRPAGKSLEIVDHLSQLNGEVPRATDYIENGLGSPGTPGGSSIPGGLGR